jgi:hypothetical protein
MDRNDARRLLAALPLLAAVATRAKAHDKDFAFTVDWALPYRGEFELESWSTWVPRSNDFEQLVKLEYGVTDSFTIEPALEFQKPNGDPFKLEAAELEAYVHFRDFGYGKLLPALEGEIERLVRQPDQEEEEEEESRATARLRGILSLYTRGGEDFTANAIVARHISGNERWEGELTAGYLRPLDFVPGIASERSAPLKAGIEMTQSLSDDHVTTIGPVVTWKALPNLNVVLGGQIALTDRDEHFDEIRLVLEWEF